LRPRSDKSASYSIAGNSNVSDIPNMKIDTELHRTVWILVEAARI